MDRNIMKIALNAKQDLWMAGFNSDDRQVARFERAYRHAAAAYAREHDLDIEIICGSGEQLNQCDTSEEAGEIWQAIHDRVQWTGPRQGQSRRPRNMPKRKLLPV